MSGFYQANAGFDRRKTAHHGKRNRPPKREHKLIAFKAFFDTDQDILDWWEGMQDGERSEVIRELLRGYVKGLPLYEARRPTMTVDGSVVLQVRDDTAWIRGALNDMPAYLERLLSQISVTAQPATQSATTSTLSDGGSLSNDALARRKAKMGKVGW